MSYKPPFNSTFSPKRDSPTNTYEVMPLTDWLKNSFEDYKKNYPQKEKKIKNVNSQWENDF